MGRLKITIAVGYDCGSAALYVDGLLVTAQVDNMSSGELVKKILKIVEADAEYQTRAVVYATDDWPEYEKDLVNV